MYKFLSNPDGTQNNRSIFRDADRASIPFDQDNRDCRQFLSDWKSGVEVLNADGSPAPYSDAAVRALGLEPA